MSTLERSIMRRFSLPLPSSHGPRTGGHAAKSMVRDFSPVHWSKYFRNKEVLNIGETSKFCVYRSSNTTKPDAPIVFFLHGGGFSALTWSLAIESLMDLVECHTVAVDLRGHGETMTASELDLSRQQLVDDLLEVARTLDVKHSPIILVGHSLGGAVAVHFAAAMDASNEFHVSGMVVIDVVEGSALESLATMNTVLRGRPPSFPNLTKAIEWCIKSGQIRNIDSARVSMPGQLKNKRTNDPATFQIRTDKDPLEDSVSNTTNDSEAEKYSGTSESSSQAEDLQPLRGDVIIEEENEIDEPVFVAPKPSAPPAASNLETLTWRIDLNLTQPYWKEWFEGLSNKFLHVSCPKLLLLAGVDRLDRELTVGQMQGKFQMHVFPNVGHAIQEDCPTDVAQSMASFFIRHKLLIGKVEVPPVFPGC